VEESALAGPGHPFDGQHLSCKDGQVDPFQDFDDFAAAPEDKGFFQILRLIKGDSPRCVGWNQIIISFAGRFRNIPSI
jgi:hypothetical protein